MIKLNNCNVCGSIAVAEKCKIYNYMSRKYETCWIMGCINGCLQTNYGSYQDMAKQWNIENISVHESN